MQSLLEEKRKLLYSYNEAGITLVPNLRRTFCEQQQQKNDIPISLVNIEENSSKI